MPGVGDRATTGPGVPSGLPPGHEPTWDTTNAGKQARYRDARDECSDPRRAGGSLRGAESRGRWGTETHGTHGRAGNAGPPVQRDSPTGETVSAPTVPPQRQRSAAQAARDPHGVCTTLAHRSDGDVLREAYGPTSTSSAPGIDGVTAQPSAAHLDAHRHDLPERRGSGRSQATPVERVWSEQEDGTQRPMGQPTCEDTIVQRAVAMRLEAIAEHDCSDGSYGLRQGRRPHDARHERRARCMRDHIGWIVEAAVSGDVDSIDRTRLRAVRRQRVKAGSRLRLMGKGLRAGGMEDKVRSHPETGGVQGGVMAPVLAPRVLHPVLEAWGAQEVRPRTQGRCVVRRFADAVVLGCESEADARRSMDVLPKRWARSGLTMHPTKTTVIACRKPAARQGSAEGSGPGDFLGLPHDWTPSRRGVWVIKRRTASTRLWRTKTSVWRWGRSNRHAPLQDQYQPWCQKLRGHVPYCGIRGNLRLLEDVGRCVAKAWRYWLSRRRNERAIGWTTFEKRMQTSVLPTPSIVHNI